MTLFVVLFNNVEFTLLAILTLLLVGWSDMEIALLKLLLLVGWSDMEIALLKLLLPDARTET
jgi:hypothetical protein